MIAMLKGKLVHQEGTSGIIDVQGVGYQVHAPAQTLGRWQEQDQVTAFISTQVREDSIHLYGFAAQGAKTTFETLLGVNGVGPKMALAALDSLTEDEIANAVERDEVGTLCRIPGVGKKKAQRLILDLKGKLSVSFHPTSPRARPVAAPADQLPLALAQLQYGKTEIDKALAGLQRLGIGVDEPIGDRLRAALGVLSGKEDK